MLGFAGHLMITTAGVSSASTSSMVMVSTALIWLEASSGYLAHGDQFLSTGLVSWPVGRCYSWRAAICL